jgi:predicted ATPase
MKIDVKVKNLGKIKEAEFHIRPMTVITGPNGTGKSFFTKSLYSILNVINKNVYHESVNNTIRQIQLRLGAFSAAGTHDSFVDIEITNDLTKLKNEFEEASNWKITDYLVFAYSKVSAVQKIQTSYGMYLNRLNSQPSQTKNMTHINIFSESINQNLEYFLLQLRFPKKTYDDLFAAHIENEFKDNFQISDLSELISFGEEKIEIKVDGLLVIELGGNKKISVEMGADFIDDVSNLSSVVFFESPAYWKVRGALISAKNNKKHLRLIGKKNNDVLTGVPKYFYDLDYALITKTKTLGAFTIATDLLENTLGGEFIFKDDSLSFKDKSGRDISKNLVSFGMTNLGMIQALLKHNVITKGSFVFIDEPETNLHPDWQVKLMEVLLILAQAGVNIVITTHSTDLLKALEVNLKKQKIEAKDDFLSVHFVDLDGKLFEFESKDSDQQLIEARNLLNSAYEKLYFSEL